MNRFAVGDYVTPKPEWIGNPNNIPSGIVRAIEPWGKRGALRVGNERRAFDGSVFDLAPADAEIPTARPAPVEPTAAAPSQGDLFEAAE